MLFNVEDIKRAIDKAREMSEKYTKKYGSGFQRSINHFWELCNEEVRREIPVYEIDMTPEETEILRGAWIRTVGYVPGDYGAIEEVPEIQGIFLQKKNNICWKRFTLCKELFQILLDDPKYREMDLEKLIDENLYPEEDIRPNVYLPGTSENITEFAAMEFLFPYQERRKHLSDQKNLDFEGVAKIYRVPQVHVEKYLTPPYMGFFSAF